MGPRTSSWGTPNNLISSGDTLNLVDRWNYNILFLFTKCLSFTVKGSLGSVNQNLLCRKDIPKKSASPANKQFFYILEKNSSHQKLMLLNLSQIF